MVILQSADNENYTVDLAVAQRSQLIKNMLEDIGESDQPIPIPNVSGRVLKKVFFLLTKDKLGRGGGE